MEPIIDLEWTIVFNFYFFLKVEPIIPTSGRLILIKKIWSQLRENEMTSFYAWQALLCLVEKSC